MTPTGFAVSSQRLHKENEIRQKRINKAFVFGERHHVRRCDSCHEYRDKQYVTPCLRKHGIVYLCTSCFERKQQRTMNNILATLDN